MSDALQATILGSCFCGAVSVSLPSPLRTPVNCHCGQCRRLSGAAWTTWITAAREHTVLHGAEHLTAFDVTANVRRHFCNRCGSHVMTEDRRLLAVYGMPAGLFEGVEIEAPKRDYFLEDKVPWADVPHDDATTGATNAP